MACYRQYVGYFKLTFPSTAPPTYEEWAINMGIYKSTATNKPVFLQNFLVIWKAPLVKKKVSASRKFLKETVDQKIRLLF